MAAKAKKATKTINYFRVNFPEPCSQTLAYYLYHSHNRLPEVAHRTFPLASQEIKGCHVSHPTESECYAHVTLTTPGEPATLVPDAHNAAQADLQQMAAPKQTNFMDGDLWFYLNDNHMLFCSTQLPVSRAKDYIHEILVSTGQPDAVCGFALNQVADVDKIQMIQNGISSISLGAGLYPASVSYLKRQTVRKYLLNGIINNIRALFEDDPELSEYRDAENITAELLLKFNRRRTGGELGQYRMQSLAEKVVEDEESEGFRIRTFNNETLTAQNIVLRKRVKIEKNGKTVPHQDVWRNMHDYFEELRDKGLLEQ